MAQSTTTLTSASSVSGHNRMKFLIGGGVIIAAIVFLIATTMTSTLQYFLTIEELQAQGAGVVGKNLRVSGAVLGDTITYDPQTLEITFEMANVPGDLAEVEKAGGLAEVLHQAVQNTSAARVTVKYIGPKPDLLRHEAQAIVTGKLGEDGVFYADELQLKCPTRYDEAAPQS
ncbi:MAG: cytochrome c maturation protein CcmE [Anaerolineales bacterium]